VIEMNAAGFVEQGQVVTHTTNGAESTFELRELLLNATAEQAGAKRKLAGLALRHSADDFTRQKLIRQQATLESHDPNGRDATLQTSEQIINPTCAQGERIGRIPFHKGLIKAVIKRVEVLARSDLHLQRQLVEQLSFGADEETAILPAVGVALVCA